MCAAAADAATHTHTSFIRFSDISTRCCLARCHSEIICELLRFQKVLTVFDVLHGTYHHELLETSTFWANGKNEKWRKSRKQIVQQQLRNWEIRNFHRLRTDSIIKVIKFPREHVCASCVVHDDRCLHTRWSWSRSGSSSKRTNDENFRVWNIITIIIVNCGIMFAICISHSLTCLCVLCVVRDSMLPEPWLSRAWHGNDERNSESNGCLHVHDCWIEIVGFQSSRCVWMPHEQTPKHRGTGVGRHRGIHFTFVRNSTICSSILWWRATKGIRTVCRYFRNHYGYTRRWLAGIRMALRMSTFICCGSNLYL